MAPPKAKQSKKKKQSAVSRSKKESTAPRLTLEELDAISSDEEDGERRGPSGNSDPEEWNAEALALRQAIKEGAFDRLLRNKLDDSKEGDEMEEASLNDESIEEEDEGDDEEQVEEQTDEGVEEDEEADKADEEDEEEDDNQEDDEDEKHAEHDEDDASLDDEDDDDSKPIATGGEEISRKALSAVTEELKASKKDMSWVETFCIIPPTPLPFANPSKRKVAAASSSDGGIDVHDDLKRELAFYNMALEAVGDAKVKCKEGGVPFSRPVDFFAEMVKTDDHMAKVKDRLIFETKKMEAVAQRKSNKEQKLRVKETHDNKLAEKAKRKKDHQRAVDDWAKSSQQSGGGGGGDDSRGGRGGGPNKKRLAADRKFGHGGQKGRFKQNDRKSMDDMSSFNPRGNFAGKGTKRTRSSSGGKGGGGGGGNRPGKRARDEGRARRRTT